MTGEPFIMTTYLFFARKTSYTCKSVITNYASGRNTNNLSSHNEKRFSKYTRFIAFEVRLMIELNSVTEAKSVKNNINNKIMIVITLF